MADRRAAVPFLILVHPVEEDGQTHSAISAADQSVAAKMMAEWSFGRMNMNTSLKSAADAVLARAVSGTPGVPGVVAVATDAKGNIYEGAAGKRQLDGSVDMTTDSVCAIFSTTKAITGTVCLQLVEEGKLDLDAPASTYAPEIAKCQVITGFDASGNPTFRPPKREITTRMLLLHTAGFAYDFFNETYNRLATDHGQPSVVTASRAAITTPILFDPGEDWEYGSNIDWAGQVVEGILGQRLGVAMQDRVFDRLGMTDSAFAMRPDMRARMATMHQRDAAGVLSPLVDWTLPQPPEIDMGGHGLYSTALDYAKFIRMWLNDGNGPNGRVLKPETVAMAEKNGLGELKIKGLPSVIPSLSNYAEFFPGMPKSWALTFMVNEEDAPTGRPAGALAWAGLANLYYWIDRKNGIGGFWATQILPFADPASVGGYVDFETAVYRNAIKAAA
ncbi:serine hydrolase [Pseudorhodobacter sp. MZDSW-24AT]|uniref:serine hydrolase domain-containing protein n=1 Tax=Pseudorhodobacter sp. MZDSW-24AT TaxID=2052957 RepID=UPI001E43E290|nr:serine hydrolase domain-containing protein [Pseudorhodobacter sp. MZDSW-24AT]